MTKDQFLRELRMELNGKVSDAVIKEQLDFYEEYIRTRSVARTEDEVTAELGSPRLIAKSIIASCTKDKQSDETVYEDGSTSKSKEHRKIKIPPFVIIVLLILIVLVVVGLLVAAVWALLPILLPLLLLCVILRILYQRRK